MQTKNPHGLDAGLEKVSSCKERFETHDTKLDKSFNTKQCGSKTPPFAVQVNQLAKLWHIYVGPDALLDAAESYYLLAQNYPTAVMALPFNRSPFEFDWQVKGRTIDILSSGNHSSIVYELGQALIICGAQRVYGLVNNQTCVWVQPIEKRWAA